MPHESMNMAHEIIAISDSLDYTLGRLEGLRLIGNSYYLIGRMDSASLYMLDLLDEAYTANEVGMQADVMIDIGQLYDKIGLHSLSYDYFKQAHEIRLQMENPERLSVTFINLAYHFYLRDMLDSALYYYQHTKTILDTLPMNYTTPFLYNELGGVYIKQRKFKEARTMIEKAMDMNRQLNNNWDLTYNLVFLAEVELEENHVNEAERAILNALKISEESDISLEYDLIYNIMSQVYASKGRHEEALDYLMRSYNFADSLELAMNDQKILALNHYKQQKENQIENLKLTNQNLEQEVRLANQRYLIITVLLVLIVASGAIGLLIFQNNRLKFVQQRIRDQNKDLKSLNKTKSKLFSILTHDIRNPLVNINSILKLAQENRINADDFQQFAGILNEQTNRLTALIETLINWSKSQQKGLFASLKITKLEELIDQSIDLVDFMATSKSIQIKKLGPFDRFEVKTDPNMLMMVINNLLTNAIKFTPPNGEVTITLSITNKLAYEIQIADTGVGISDDFIQNLMEGNVTSQPGTQSEKGSGVGLMLILDLISYLGGKLIASKNQLKGSTFTIVLPFDGGSD